MLNWLQRIDRTLPKPRIVMAPMEQPACALYYCPWPWVETMNGKEYDRREGAIIHLNSAWQDDWDLPAVLAHEWRHHWQFLSGIEYDGNADCSVKEGETQSESNLRFYRACKCERDALFFELRVSPGEWNQLDASALGRNVRRVIYSFPK